MARTLKFKRVENNLINKANRVAKWSPRDVDDAAKHLVIVAWKIAKRSMKKAPKRPKSRFGSLQAYKKGRQKYGQYYWRKGQYSRPGHPPFYHGDGKGLATLKSMKFGRIKHGKWYLRPRYLSQRSRPKIPDLHEFGGRVKKLNKVYYDKRGNKVKRRTPDNTAIYPKRPFLAPAMIKARLHIARGKSFIQRVNGIARLKPTRRAAA